MTIGIEDVRHVAMLARLEMSSQEEAKFMEQLNAILEAAQKLQALNTEDVEPTAHVLPLHNVFREDNYRPSMEQKKIVANAPEEEDGFFKVPKIL